MILLNTKHRIYLDWLSTKCWNALGYYRRNLVKSYRNCQAIIRALDSFDPVNMISTVHCTQITMYFDIYIYIHIDE
jgi:hypothetical protein